MTIQSNALQLFFNTNGKVTGTLDNLPVTGNYDDKLGKISFTAGPIGSISQRAYTGYLIPDPHVDHLVGTYHFIISSTSSPDIKGWFAQR
jgi:hypothetical protein